VDGLAFGAMPEEAQREAGRLRLIALVHHPLAMETGIDSSVARALEASERRALAAARHVIVTSRATADDVAAYGVPRDRIAVVEPGTDPAPQSRGSGGERTHFLCVAALVPRKGHEILFRALGSMSNRSDWLLTCVGSADRNPETADALCARLRADGLGDRVRLAGEADAHALAAHYDEADVFVLPTLHEGYGMAVAEALAHGLPVISTPTGAIGDLVGEDAGLLVPPGDAGALTAALSRVLDNEALRRRLRAGAIRARTRLHTWDDASARMADVLGRVTVS
jgi:glycosyltransferase involved in cell wall biosynthesis